MTDTTTAGEGPATTAGPRSDASRVRRLPQRAAYDEASIHAVLDASLIGHVGIVAGDRPVVIPMLYGRDGSTVYLHGSVASRLLRSLAGGIDLCLTVTLVDGLVLARSAFHHSMNYRSVVAFGRATLATGDDKLHGLRVISEHLAPGRWDEVARAERPRAAADVGPADGDPGGLGQGPRGRSGRRRGGPRAPHVGRGPPLPR